MKVNNKTIIITDPCYIIKNGNRDDWEKCDFGDNMEALGIENYICRDTGYGDWSCTTYELGTNKELGRFCADAGLVAVFLLDEVLAYNPDFKCPINEHQVHWATVIPNFTGNVFFKIIPDEDMDIVSVVGDGNINFYTEQTGF